MGFDNMSAEDDIRILSTKISERRIGKISYKSVAFMHIQLV